ncbi:MAG TPA: DUF2079 domain-containing protein [Candidatus Eisenbacteria bacterium]|nr:DUF2079 domain-containing protein [Candidatus Eisenbacteria bacterium]
MAAANGAVEPGRERSWPSLATWYWINAAVLVVAVLVPVWMRTALHRYHNLDLGYFAQALHGIRWNDLDPFIPARNLRLFSDHFDPILILFAPLAHVMEPAYASLLVDQALLLLTPLPILLLARGRAELLGLGYVATTYLLFNRAILLAIDFPVHPTAWAAPFVVALAVGLIRRATWLTVASALLLMACKEEFPFAVLAIGAALLLARDRRAGQEGRRGWVLVALASVWTILAFVVRPAMLGDTANHAARVLGPLGAAPVATILDRLRSLDYVKPLLQALIPLAPVLYWRARQGLPPQWPFLLALVPLLGIRFVTNAWGLHYMSPIPAFLAAAFLGPDLVRLPRKYVVAVAALVLAVGIAPLAKGIGSYRSLPDFAAPRYRAIESARLYLKREPEGAILTHGNLAPLLAARGNVWGMGGWQSERDTIDYRYLLAEIPPRGNPYPWTHEQAAALIESWRRDPANRILRDDAQLFFAERTTWRKRPAGGR